MTVFSCISNAHTYANSTEGQAEIESSLVGATYDTARAALLAVVAGLSAEEFQERKTGWSIAGIKDEGGNVTFEATFHHSNDHLNIGEGGALWLMNETHDFEEEYDPVTRQMEFNITSR